MNTRKKVIKTVYKDDEGSEEEGADFSDASSEVKYSGGSSSEEEDLECVPSSGDEFVQRKSKPSTSRKPVAKKPKFAKNFIKKINKQTDAGAGPSQSEDFDVSPALFSVMDLTEADKRLPSILNLSESDSSEDESPRPANKNNISSMSTSMQYEESDSDNEQNTEYKDIWSNLKDENSEEIAKKTFMELEQHKSRIEEAKVSLQNYTVKTNTNIVKQESSDVKDLLALGEDVQPQEKFKKKPKVRKIKDDSDSEMEDWEEVKEQKAIPQQGIQLFVEFPDGGCRKSKKVDVEMMMRRKINRVKKEYQVYMHKVHVLCWIGHGNYISRVLNDQEIMAAVLALVPSKECYPGERVDMKYVEQITKWYNNKLTLKQDKNEDKYKPKAPPLKDILLEQIKKKIVTTKKYLVFVFVAMLRALGLQCRVMFNFVSLPIKPPSYELCSLSIKPKDQKSVDDKAKPATEKKNAKKADKKASRDSKKKISQVDGNNDEFYSENEDIMQLDGNDDSVKTTRKTRSAKRPNADDNAEQNEDVSPPKLTKNSSEVSSEVKHKKKEVAQESNRTQRIRNRNLNSNDTNVKQNTQVLEDPKKFSRTKRTAVKNIKETKDSVTTTQVVDTTAKTSKREQKSVTDVNKDKSGNTKTDAEKKPITKSGRKTSGKNENAAKSSDSNKLVIPTISIKDEKDKDVSSKYFETSVESTKTSRLSRKRSQTAIPASKNDNNTLKPKGRTKSAPNNSAETSKYFNNENVAKKQKKEASEDSQRVSHRDLTKDRSKAKNDVTADLVDIMKKRIKEAKDKSKKGLVKGKITKESDEDSDYLPVEDPKRKSGSDDDFKPMKISPKPCASRVKDRRVLSSTEDEPVKKNKIDVWCEIFVEELEQWISVDVIKGKVHSTGDLYNNATHPVCYVVGWDNNNYLKDLTRKYVPHWNTVTRKQRAEPAWWDKAVRPWLGPKTARDREEDEYLDKMQLEAPLPKSIAEYKNHPLYALKRHLLKFEAIYPPDASVLGFVRNEPVYARECVYTCRSRDTWLKEAKVVKLGEQPYKVVKARPKWDKLSNKLITDKPLEVFGPWQVNDYEPPVAENGIVPRNAYGNVELFKDCMLPIGTVHIKLPSLNRVAKKLNIDCAPAMTGFDFNGGWSHPVYDGFVVCKEFEEIITEAWVKDQEEQERRELEKLEARVYGNWKRLIKGLLIKARLKDKYGFEEPKTEPAKSKGPRLVVKKKS